MRLSRFVFIVSTVSTFGALWAMLIRLAPRDTFAWIVAIFSLCMMVLSAIYVTSPRT